MKHAKTLLYCPFLLIAVTATSLFAVPLGTAFTYQGRLDFNGGTAPNGVYLMYFTLHDASSNGNQIASQPTNAVSVTNSLFVVNLDFGAAAFVGDARWLQINVRTNGGVATNLSPRVRIAPTPNAIYAATAGTVTNGAIRPGHLATPGAPGANQVLGYDGASLAWLPGGGAASVWTLNGTSAYYNQGRVGIGTTTPLAGLEIFREWDTQHGALTLRAQRPTMRLTGGPETGNRSWLVHLSGNGPGNLEFFRDEAGSWANVMSLAPNGNVGIGITSPASKLDVRHSSGIAVFGESTAGVGVFGRSATGEAVHGESGGSFAAVVGVNLAGGAGVYGESRGAGAALFGRSTTGEAVHGESSSDIAAVVAVNSGQGAGLYGENQGSGVGVFGESRGSGVGVFARSLTGSAIRGESSTTFATLVGVNTANGTGVYGESLGGGYGGYFVGRVRVGVLEIAGGADLAEPFPMKEEIVEKGSVVVIDEEHPGRLQRSTRAYDTRVAGIVSGANGISPGISLKQERVLDQGENVALTGRVYVKADASFGPIKPGDLLTTSDTPGHAMKVTDSLRAQGAILGKAMSALSGGTGLVLVLVTLQ